MPRSAAFYSERISDAADALTGTKYKAATGRLIKAEAAFLAALSGAQKALYEELDDSRQSLEVITGDAAYKAGLLEGYAAGRTLSEKYRELEYSDD